MNFPASEHPLPANRSTWLHKDNRDSGPNPSRISIPQLKPPAGLCR